MESRESFFIDGIHYRLFPQYGAYFGIGRYEDRPYVSVIGLTEDGDIDRLDGQPNVGEVCNAGDTPEEAEQWVAAINAQFGTSFTVANFPGR